MIFKKLEMHGFKSFFDKTVVDFQSGINAVVGPNGCGKSNIADAIRWVLGEQSPKRLRGENMEDLIFSGSDAKRPLGMAEVCLTVESNGLSFPSPYDQFTEVCVTRRLYRSGDSEFLINNTQCRLRDIRELFLDTGLNPKAYAVIDQGHIGDIMASKPEDRRVFIEEAAGIARYKERKAAALRKLDSTEQNLLRLHDIVREIKRQIRSLKLQATKARKYNELKEEIEALDLKLLYQQYHLRHEEERLHGRKRGELDEIGATLKREQETEETAVETEKLRLVEIEKELGAAQEEVFSQRARNDSLASLLEASRKRCGEVEHSMGRGEDEIAGEERRMEQLSEERLLIEQEIEELAARIAASEETCRNGEEALGETARALATLREETARRNALFLDEVRASGETQNRITEAETMKSSMVRDLERLAADVSSLAAEIVSLNSQCRELGSRLEARRTERETVRTELVACTKSVLTMTVDLEEKEVKLQEARDEHGKASSRLASLVELEENISGWPERFRTNLEKALGTLSLNGHVKGLLASYVEAPAEYETALEAVLGERLKCLVVSDHGTAVEAARAMGSESEVRGTFLPQSPRRESGGGPVTGPGVIGPLAEVIAVPEPYRATVSHLLANVVLVEDVDAASRFWAANGAARTFVTPRGEVVWPDGSLTAGPLDQSREILPLLRRIRETKADAATWKDRVDELAGERTSLRKELEELRGREEELGSRLHGLDIAVTDLEKDFDHASQKKVSREEHTSRLGAQVETVEGEIRGLDEQLTEARSRHSRSEEKRRRHEEEMTSLQGRLEATVAATEEQERTLGGLRIELAAGKERSGHLGSRRERITAEREQSRERCELLRAEIEKLRIEKEEEEDRRAGMQAQLDDLDGHRRERERVLADLQEKQRHTAGGIREKEENIRRIRLKADEIREEIAGLGAREAEIRVRLENLRERVLAVKGVLPEDLWDDETGAAVLAEEAGTLEEEHRGKVAKLQSLGAVNLAAIGDHEELQERLEFQVKQQEDLEKAAADLRQAISRINSTSRQKFIETFEAVNEHFQNIFPILFQKGQAMLRLTETDDPLEAGIEVLAQPAGKKLQRMTLLSGGEKALSAIALLLSIFMVKPTPFCLLDEVDAPLDETNTERFLELLKTSINGSQLVVITHNKQTMGHAVNLVGVTMADPGVSSLMSVKLQEV